MLGFTRTGEYYTETTARTVMVLVSLPGARVVTIVVIMLPA